MKFFLFESAPVDGDTDEYPVFARDQARASELFALFWGKRDRLPPEFSGEDFEKYELSGNRKQMHDALALNMEGLGCYDPATGWIIIPPYAVDDPDLDGG